MLINILFEFLQYFKHFQVTIYLQQKYSICMQNIWLVEFFQMFILWSKFNEI